MNWRLALAVFFCYSCLDRDRQTFERLDASNITHGEIEWKVGQLMDSARVTGLAVSLFDNYKIVYKNTFGYRNKKQNLPLTDSTNLYAASLSKAVFSYLALNLSQEGIIDLNTPLQDYLDEPLPDIPFEKEWRGFANLKDDPRYQIITARMCLSHTTGFPNWRWVNREGQFFPKGKLHFYFDPGTEYSYSGEGIRLLQVVVERLMNQDLETLARLKIFEPIGMDHTSYVWQKKFENNFSVGHTQLEEVIKKDIEDEPGAAGSMETTPTDYTNFLGHILKLCSQESTVTEQMFAPQIRIKSKQQFGPLSLEQTDENDGIELSYALGWGRIETPYGYGVFKEGHGNGFQHYTILFPESGKGIMLMSNSDNAESIYKELLNFLLKDIYTPWYWENYIPYDSDIETASDIYENIPT